MGQPGDHLWGLPLYLGLLRAKLQVDQNPQVEVQHIWMLLERICTFSMILDNYLQVMLLLSAIPQEWDRIASMYYCKDMTRSCASFDGVQTTIMAEYEWTAHLSQLVHHVDKISAVKHKGKSPQFKEQKQYSAPRPPAAADAPSGSSSKKQTRGGKTKRPTSL